MLESFALGCVDRVDVDALVQVLVGNSLRQGEVQVGLVDAGILDFVATLYGTFDQFLQVAELLEAGFVVQAEDKLQ